MPALVGQVVITLRNETGVSIFTITENYTDGTGLMRNADVTTSTGVRNGALVVDNQTGGVQAVVIRDAAGTILKTINIAANGAALTVAQLSAIGITTIQDLAGISPALT